MHICKTTKVSTPTIFAAHEDSGNENSQSGHVLRCWNNTEQEEHKDLNPKEIWQQAVKPGAAEVLTSEDVGSRELSYIASRYENPLTDSASDGCFSLSNEAFSPDDGADQNHGEIGWSNLCGETPPSSSLPDGADSSDFWKEPHPPRRVFSVKNKLDFPVVLALRFLLMQMQPTSRQFHLFTSSGARLVETSRLVIEPRSVVEIVVQVNSAEDVGMVTQFLVFDLELPARWARSPSDASHSVAEEACCSSSSLASSLLSFDVKHVTIVRALKVINVDPHAIKVLSREAKPFFPRELKTCFDAPADLLFQANPPPLPGSFTSLLAQLPHFELPRELELLHARRHLALSCCSGGDPAELSAKNTSEDFAIAWARHTEQVKKTWFATTLHLDALQSASDARQCPSLPKNVNSNVHALICSHLCNQHIGLHAEELQMSLDVRSYDLYYVPLKQVAELKGPIDEQQEFVNLRVPGVAERRPALSLGDRVQLRLADRSDTSSSSLPSISIDAYVHSVREDTVCLTFPLAQIVKYLQHELAEKIAFTRKKEAPRGRERPIVTTAERMDAFFSSCLFHVRFGFDRISFRFMYRALQALQASPHSAERFLFPSVRHVGSSTKSSVLSMPPELPTFEPVDSKLNFEQLTAVQHIVAKSHGEAPFVIFGPPGELGGSLAWWKKKKKKNNHRRVSA